MTPFIEALKKKGNISGFLKEMNKRPLVLAPAAIIGAGGLQKQKKGGKIKKDDMGYWNPDNWGEAVEIDSDGMNLMNRVVDNKDNNEDLFYAQEGGSLNNIRNILNNMYNKYE